MVKTDGGKEYPGKITLFVFITCLIAATGGLIFGYDIGISGNYLIDQNTVFIYSITFFIINFDVIIIYFFYRRGSDLNGFFPAKVLSICVPKGKGG